MMPVGSPPAPEQSTTPPQSAVLHFPLPDSSNMHMHPPPRAQNGPDHPLGAFIVDVQFGSS